MNPWRKRRRQKLRRQNAWFNGYIQWLNVVDIATVTFEPIESLEHLITVVPSILRINNDDGTEESDADLIKRAYGIDFTKPMPRIAHDPSEFFGLEDL